MAQKQESMIGKPFGARDKIGYLFGDFGNDFTELVLQVIEDKDGIATGEMYDTLGWRIEETENGLTLFLTHTDYFVYWNSGTTAHCPPQEPIEKWVVDKGIQSRPMRVVRTWKWTTKDGVEHQNGKEVTILPTVQQIAFLVRRKISLEGTEPFMARSCSSSSTSSFICSIK